MSEDFKSTVFDWYQDREVASNEKFVIWFRRIISRDYKRYNELLRIEPGISEYDWLVQKYEEAQTYNQEERESETTGTASTTKATGGTITDAGTNSETASKTTAHDESNRDTLTGTRTEDTTANKTIDHTESNGDTLTIDHTESNGDTLTIDRTEENGDTLTIDRTETGTIDTTDTASGTDTTTESGSKTHEYTITRSSQDVTAFFEDTTGSSQGDSQELSRANPMSMSYASGGFPSTLDWQNPSGQSETKGSESSTGHRESDNTLTKNSSDTNDGTDTNASTKALQHGEAHTIDTDTSKDIDESRTGTQSKDIDETRTGTQSKDIDETRTGTETKDIDITEAQTVGKEIQDSQTKTQTKDIDISETVQKSGTNGNTRTLDTEEETTGTTGQTVSAGSEKLQQHIHTGRDIDIASLLENASRFIKYSSAWAWMQSRLDECFMGIYE